MKFPKLVIEEATNLRKFATKNELDKLDFEQLDPEAKDRCVYGQMTGDCFSERATELIIKCTKKVYVKTTKDVSFMEDVCDRATLNGQPIASERRGDETWWYSPIEIFISKAHSSENDTANKKLLSFIKGEIKSL